MKRIVTAFALLVSCCALAHATFPAETNVVNFFGRTPAPALELYQAASDAQAFALRKGSANFDGTGWDPYAYWTGEHLTGIVAAASAWIDQSNGIFRADWTPAMLNTNGSFTYGVGVKQGTNVYVAQHGDFTIIEDKYASGVGPLVLVSNVNIGAINWIGDFPLSALTNALYLGGYFAGGGTGEVTDLELSSGLAGLGLAVTNRLETETNRLWAALRQKASTQDLATVQATWTAALNAYSNGVSNAIAHGSTAYGWGNHASAGYATAEDLSDLAGRMLEWYAGSGTNLTLGGTTRVDRLESRVAAANRAAVVLNGEDGYLLSGSEVVLQWWPGSLALNTNYNLTGFPASSGGVTNESDPVWLAASGVVTSRAAHGEAAYGWGNHATAGYLTSLGAAHTGAVVLAGSGNVITSIAASASGGPVTGYLGTVTGGSGVASYSNAWWGTAVQNLGSIGASGSTQGVDLALGCYVVYTLTNTPVTLDVTNDIPISTNWSGQIWVEIRRPADTTMRTNLFSADFLLPGAGVPTLSTTSNAVDVLRFSRGWSGKWILDGGVFDVR